MNYEKMEKITYSGHVCLFLMQAPVIASAES